MKRTEKLLWWLNIFVAVLTLLSYIAPYINPQKIWQASFLGLAYPTLFWINLLFLGGWSLKRSKKLLLPLIVILLGWSALRSYVGMNFSPPAVFNAQDLSLLSYNTNALYGIRNEKAKPKRLALESIFKKFILDQQANIICLQEFPISYETIFQDSVLFSRFEVVVTPTGTLLSKWPIIQTKAEFFPNSANGYVWADIKTTTDTLRVFNVHMESNAISKQTSEVLAADLKEQETWTKVRGLLGKVNVRTLKRVDQARAIAAMMAASPHPIILAGDFNNTPQSYTYKLLAQNLTDTYREKGLGIGTTYRGNIPSLRLDYILLDPKFETLSSKVISVDHSDHYPVLSTFTRRP